MSGSEYERYGIAIEMVKYEGELLWQVFGAFLLAHTVFMAFLLPSALDKTLPANHSGPFFAACLGLVLCIPWLSAYLRSSAYYTFRIAQAKEVEPGDLPLLKGAGNRFAEGECVVLGNEHYKQPWLARQIRTRRAVPFLITVFILAYLAIAIASGPWWH